MNTQTTDRTAAIGIARRFLDAMAAMDFDGAADMLAEDCTVEMPNGQEPTQKLGRETVRSHFKNDIPGFLSRISFDVEREAFDPEQQRVVLEYRSEGARADGRPYGNRYIGTWDIRGGKIGEWREYFNPMKFG